MSVRNKAENYIPVEKIGQMSLFRQIIFFRRNF